MYHHYRYFIFCQLAPRGLFVISRRAACLSSRAAWMGGGAIALGRAGGYVVNLTGEAAYRSFRPAPLPPEPSVALDGEMVALLAGAHRCLGELNAVASALAEPDLLVSMYVRKEALMSAQIEGTQCTLDDILDPLAGREDADVADVVNYVAAVRFAIGRLADLPICGRLLREAHAILTAGIRGGEPDKRPGEFRRSQNWIGPAGGRLADARFVPPNPDDMIAALADLERYINADDDTDAIVRTALVHYQFETIHPFLDGNGRVGRLLILLCLMSARLIDRPILYVSYFLKKNQLEYYDRLNEVRRTGDYEQWVRFFAEAVRAAAADATASIRRLADLRERNLARLPKNARLRAVFDYIERRPITDVASASKALGVSWNTAASAIKRLEATGILRQTDPRAARGRLFAYDEYLAILREGTEVRR